MAVVPWDLDTELVHGCSTEGFELGLVSKVKELLLSPRKACKLLPPIELQKVVIPTIEGDCYWVRLPYEGQRLPCDLPVLPADAKVELGSSVVGVASIEGGLVAVH